jgi:DNA-binding transcriptional regulator YhcF (GntR family)
MDWNFENDRPIYIQLVEKLKLAIVAGEYPAGERLPSVRDLAMEIKANPNTVQRALVDLEQTGLIYTQRTNGKFVTEDKELVQKIREELAKQAFNKFQENMKQLGFGEDEMKQYVMKQK